MTKKEALRIKKRLERGTATAAERGVYDAWATSHNKGRRGPKVKLSADYAQARPSPEPAEVVAQAGSAAESTDPPPLGEEPVKEAPKVVAPLIISDTHKAMAAGLLSFVQEANAWNRAHGARITLADDSVVWKIVGGAYERIFARYMPDLDIEGETTDEMVAAGVTGSIAAQRIYLGYLDAQNPSPTPPSYTPDSDDVRKNREESRPETTPPTPDSTRMNEQTYLGDRRAGIVARIRRE